MTEDTRYVHEHVLSLLEAENAASVLDLGCGRGDHLRMLAQAMPAGVRLVGLDFRNEVLEEAYGWERSRGFEGLIKRGVITRREYDAFIDGLEQLAEQDRFFFAITMFSYVGVKVAR